ncbi:MAG: hypothetical protein JWQ78_1379 [Sediminibacterium sp.]|nr:hypothetical protein [Sediminibacterium sp.]
MTKDYWKLVRPLLILFVIVTGLVPALHSRLAEARIDGTVVIIANTLLFFATMLNVYFQFRNISNPNPNAVIRGVMGGMFLKLFALAGAVIIYLLAAGPARSVNAVFIGMGLYIIYTWLEVRISLRLNPKK